MHQVVEVNGYTVNPSGQVFPGGLLTQATDLGEHSRDRLAFVPEVTLNLGYQVTPHLRVYVGYDGLDIHRVAQPGDQIGFFTSTTQVTFAGTTTATVTQAAFHFKDTEVWCKGQTLASSSAIEARLFLLSPSGAERPALALPFEGDRRASPAAIAPLRRRPPCSTVKPRRGPERRAARIHECLGAADPGVALPVPCKRECHPPPFPRQGQQTLSRSPPFAMGAAPPARGNWPPPFPKPCCGQPKHGPSISEGVQRCQGRQRPTDIVLSRICVRSASSRRQ